MRLSDATLAQIPPSVARPAFDRRAAKIGVVHLGPGAFHRAHQLPVFDTLNARDPRWAVAEVALKTPGVRDALQPQDGLYALKILDAQPSLSVVGAIRDLLVAPESPAAVLARLAHPDTRLVTLTVTEKGYGLGPDGELDLTHPDIRADLAGTPTSAIGWLAAGLAARRAADLPPFDVLSCDNLSDNGGKLRRAVLTLAREQDPDLARWIEDTTRFPSSMVDSITPATDDALRAAVAAELGLEDAWPIQREAFTQWVVEDDFSPSAPDWAAVGVEVTSDVHGYERAKLRLLNGAHSTLAYLGLLRGHETVAEAMADASLADFIRTLMIEDIAPSLTAPPGFDTSAYIADVLKRFRNPAIRHRLSQIAWDGSQKLPIRLLGVIRDALAAGRPIGRLAVPVAAWMKFVVGRIRSGEPPVDPLAAVLMALGPNPDVAAFLRIDAIFGPNLTVSDPFFRAVSKAYAQLEPNYDQTLAG